MTHLAAGWDIVLDQLPGGPMRAAVGHLDEARRECQLIALSDQPERGDQRELLDLARSLVDPLQTVAEVIRGATLSRNDDGTYRLVGTLTPDGASAMRFVAAVLPDLERFAAAGSLLLGHDPDGAALLSWVWAEVARQRGGAVAQPYPSGT